MKNEYRVMLVNKEGCTFDFADHFTSVKAVREWSKGRGEKYTAHVYKNNELSFSYQPRN